MVFMPFSDDRSRIWVRYHYVTVAIVLLCVAAFVFQQSSGLQLSAIRFGLIPSVLTNQASIDPALGAIPSWFTTVTYNFLHGGWAHLAGNMLFLWVFGDNIEDAMGHRRFALFFVLCGVVAGLTHTVVDTTSDIPLVGASGAISGVLGAYFVLHPMTKVWVLLFVIPMKLPTFVILGVWIGIDVFNAIFLDARESGVAWWAHVGGFVAGAVLIRWFKHDHLELWDRSGDEAWRFSLTLPSERRRKKQDPDSHD